jgi:hypothetical protein
MGEIFPNAHSYVKPTMKATFLNNDLFDLGLHVLGSRAEEMEFVFKYLVNIRQDQRDLSFQCISGILFIQKISLLKPVHKFLSKCAQNNYCYSPSSENS